MERQRAPCMPREQSWLSLSFPLHTVQCPAGQCGAQLLPLHVRMIRVKPIKVSVALATATRIG
jgi:hypothetical protein